MKVICNRGALLDALMITSTVITARTPKPVLQCVRLAAEGNELTIGATDLEVSIRYNNVQVEVSEPGVVLVPGEKLRDIVRESIDDTLSIESAAEMAKIKGADAEFEIYTRDPAEFPEIGSFEGEAQLTVQGGQLRQLIHQTIFAASRESTRYAFNGALLNVKNKKISLVATDGRRLAEARGELAAGPKGELRRVIIPSKTLALVDRLIEDHTDAVDVQVNENNIVVRTQRATLTSNLLEGQFPPYEDVIPKETDKKMTAPTADFLSAVRRAALLSNEETKGVRMAFTKKGLVISSQAPGAGKSTINFACKYDGDDIAIGFNPHFLIEALKVVDSDEVTLEMVAPSRPGLLRGGANFQYVIMPVNLQ